MNTQTFRNATGGVVDRSQRLEFTFDGNSYWGLAGDTLAAALLANGVRLVGRSFKYHRPRGVFGFGVEEPNALVQLRSGDRSEPNLRATQVELFDGLVATSQNRWPSLEADVSQVNNWFSRFLPAGFYYKTFMWPARWWPRYEHLIRNGAGLGEAPTEPDADHYAKRFAHCDVLVVGGGPAGLMAALAAGNTGARVIIVDENASWGGALRYDDESIDNAPARDWVQKTLDQLDAMPNVRTLGRSTAFGYYDQNLVALVERVADHLPRPLPYAPRQRLWWVRAKRVVLATGAIERPLVFAGNDVPGVMLASAVRGYALQHAVRCGCRAVIFTNNDGAYQTVDALRAVGVDVVALVDSRRSSNAGTSVSGIELLYGHVVIRTRGRKALSAVDVMTYDGRSVKGERRRIECDLLCVSGGWSPTVHLFSQSRGRLHYNENISAFEPGDSVQAEASAGAARGIFDLASCMAEGCNVGLDSARKAGFEGGRPAEVPLAESRGYAVEPLWEVVAPKGVHGKRFVDLQNDVTAGDVALAAREGYHSVEHVKRYTTLGMGTDQGRTSNVNGLAILAAQLGKDIPSVGTTTFRPPYSAVTMGALAAGECGAHFAPLRRSPIHAWHLRHGAVMVNVGLWQRAQYYPRCGESINDAINREARHVREKVGVVDVSTLGKIEIQGRDTAAFLERIYINRWQSLKVGRARYGLMLREDGCILDDGTTTRIGEQHFYMTTTTANAAVVLAHLEFHAQTVWPELHVHFTSVTDQWGGMALAGPHARSVLAAVVDDGVDVSNEALPFLGYKEVTIAGRPVRIFRITFSGEMAYEIHMPSDYGEDVWQAVIHAGQAWDLIPYGTEAMSVLRIEKGHIVGAELDGRTVPGDFGFHRMQKRDADFIGKRALERPAFSTEPRQTFVGLVSEDGQAIPRGSHVLLEPQGALPVRPLGHVTSRCFSANLGKQIGLALIDDADTHQGQRLYAVSPLTSQTVPVHVTGPVFIDPQGERPRG